MLAGNDHTRQCTWPGAKIRKANAVNQTHTEHDRLTVFTPAQSSARRRTDRIFPGQPLGKAQMTALAPASATAWMFFCRGR